MLAGPLKTEADLAQELALLTRLTVAKRQADCATSKGGYLPEKTMSSGVKYSLS